MGCVRFTETGAVRVRTRLTEQLGIELPIISAPMGFLAGGRLAAAVSSAGGLGLIGGGYGDRDWLDRAFAAAGNTPVGCGFITWSLAKRPNCSTRCWRRSPAALMLSFGSPAPFAAHDQASGAPLICQVQSTGTRARGGGRRRGCDRRPGRRGRRSRRYPRHAHPRTRGRRFPRRHAPDTLLVAAGGIADGRGLAAALMLGADGVLIGSRLVASSEAETPPGFHDAIVVADGDATVKTTVSTSSAATNGRREFSGRALRNRFVTAWHGRETSSPAGDQRGRAGALLENVPVGRCRQYRRFHRRSSRPDPRLTAGGRDPDGDGG